MPKRRPALDGLRGVAILLVVLYHFHVPGPRLRHLVGGWCGVDVFFVLSGFLITSLLIEEREGTGTISFRGFYQRRWTRLGPALLAVLAVMEVVNAVVTWPGDGTYGAGTKLADLGALFSFGLNWWKIVGFRTPPFMGATWSLAIEEQFYLVWPLVILAAYRRCSHVGARRLLIIISAGGAAISALECFAFYPHHEDQIRTYFGTDTRAQGLFIGVLVALIWSSGRRLAPRQSALLGWAGILVIAVIAWTVDDTSPFRVKGSFTVLAAATAAAILHVLREPESALARVLSWAPLRWLGLRSYAIYLWHAPIATFLYSNGDATSGSSRFGWPGYIGGIALSLALAELSWHLIEHRRTRRGAPTPTVTPALEAAP